MRLRKKVITVKWLKEQNACDEAIKAFRKKFGKKAAVQDVATALIPSRPSVDMSHWRCWLLDRVLLGDAEHDLWVSAFRDKSGREYAAIDRAWLRKIANS